MGQKLLIDVLGIPSLSYPTWINDANYTECVAAYNDTRCSMIGAFLSTNQVSLSVSWGGGFYDLTGLTKNASGLHSQPSSGYLALKSNGNKVTISQGNYSGLVYVWENDISNGTIAESVTPWDARGGDRSFTNSECNSWWCGVLGRRIDRDTYVFMTEGPAGRLLTGTYTVEVEARLAHDKDMTDNTASYSYTLSAPPTPVTPTPTPSPIPELMLGSIGPGTHRATLHDIETSHRYSFEVPPEVEQVRAHLSVPGTADFDIFGQPAVPVPNRNLYPEWCAQCGDCWSSRMGLGLDETCIMLRPQPGTNYLIVQRMAGSGTYTLRLEFIYPTTPTPSATTTPTPSPTPSPTPLPMQWENEPNDGSSTATRWIVGGPMSGALAWEGDQDYYRLDIPDSAIYTITLDQVPAGIAADLTLYRAGTLLIAEHSAGPGEPSSLSFDANHGEVFHLRVRARQRTQYSEQHYLLTMSWLPDPTEPNDRFADATEWNAAAGPISGFFWERFSGPGDYYVFDIPGNGAVGCTLELSGVASNVTPYLIVYRPDRTTLTAHRQAGPGDTIQLSFNAAGGSGYFALVRPSSVRQTSQMPYTLSATFGPPTGDTSGGIGREGEPPPPIVSGTPTPDDAYRRQRE